MNVGRKIFAKPWLTIGAPDNKDDIPFGPTSQKQLAFSLFLAVITMLFVLLGAAYYMRMELPDWTPLSEPRILWFNTLGLILSSITFQWARISVDRGNVDAVFVLLVLAGVTAFAFVLGQLLAWYEYVAGGYLVASTPAASFFYLLTALHGLHLVGGLVVWLLTIASMWGGASLGDVRLRIELCAVYWHFLLLVWIVMFGLLLST